MCVFIRQGYEQSEAYIATQGSKFEAIFEFWRMIWEKKVARIVMLNILLEEEQKQCDLYWPEDKPLVLLNLTVDKESVRISNDYTVRTFVMASRRETRRVSTPRNTCAAAVGDILLIVVILITARA